MKGRSFERVGWELHTRARKKQAGYVRRNFTIIDIIKNKIYHRDI